MSEQNLNLRAGELIVFSQGGYSDYGYIGQFVVLRDVTETEVREVADKVREKDDDYSKHEDFIAGLVRIGALANINMREIHLGSYGELELS